ncbi:hypothetical protein O0L34_g11219 [Tuta absoluta]|nr:hypothetical protein O0L34_g11219 [Tuta absoluta]
MRGRTLLVLLLIWGQDAAQSIRKVAVSAPSQAAVGKEAIFGCQYEIGDDDLLYSVKWYKDGREIYRYMPRNPPGFTLLQFSAPGVNVDLSRSSPDVMILTNLQRESAGVYRCEVTGEAPVFANAADEKYVEIYDLPKGLPQITGLKNHYEIGDRVVANCSSSGSRPSANIRWLVNNERVHSAFLRGPWHRVTQDPPDTTEVTLGVNFMVVPRHYKTGVMEIKCQATIPPLYQKEDKQWFTLNPIKPLEQELFHKDFANVLSSQRPDIFIIGEEDFSHEVEDDVPEDRGDAIRKIYNKLKSESDMNLQPDRNPTMNEIHDILKNDSEFNLPASIHTQVPQDIKDAATVAEKSLGVMIITLLIQLIVILIQTYSFY